MNPRLAEIAEVLEASRLAAELLDPQWRLLWVSDELKALLGEDDEERLGVGRHILEARSNELWTNSTTQESRVAWTNANLAYIIGESPPELLEAIERPQSMGDGEPSFELLGEPRAAPQAWSYEISYKRPGFPPMPIRCLAMRIHDDSGDVVGTAHAYTPALPAGIIDLVARGDEEMFERMARLVDPGRRQAAILFADLQASGTLSRRLSSAAYFRLIRDLTTAIDDVVGINGGVVGKHAGDGVTAFFLAADAGSESAAAGAAVEAARAIGSVAHEVAAGSGGLTEEDVRMNVGIHWSGALYMGQVVTGGRLEVTALGDEMNECARMQQTARDGAALASKALLERLDGEDSGRLEIDPDAIAYRSLAELPGADEKAIRDAGAVAVAELPVGD